MDATMYRAWAESIARRHEANPGIEWQIETGIAGPMMEHKSGARVAAHKVYAPAKLTGVDVNACVLHVTTQVAMQRQADQRTIEAQIAVDLPLWLVQTLTDMSEAAKKLSSNIVAPVRM